MPRHFENRSDFSHKDYDQSLQVIALTVRDRNVNDGKLNEIVFLTLPLD